MDYRRPLPHPDPLLDEALNIILGYLEATGQAKGGRRYAAPDCSVRSCQLARGDAAQNTFRQYRYRYIRTGTGVFIKTKCDGAAPNRPAKLFGRRTSPNMAKADTTMPPTRNRTRYSPSSLFSIVLEAALWSRRPDPCAAVEPSELFLERTADLRASCTRRTYRLKGWRR
jgi:hypothetical protein